MRSLVLLAAVVLSGLSGCLAGPQERPPAVAAPAAVPDPLANVTTLHWAGNLTGSNAVAISVLFTEEQPTTCPKAAMYSFQEGGRDTVHLVDTTAETRWSGTHGGSAAIAHAGPASTDDAVGEGGGGGGGTVGDGFRGLATFTFLVNGAAPDDRFLSGASMVFDLECEDPFSVVDARASQVLLLGSSSGLRGGVGAEAAFTGFDAGDRGSVTLASPGRVLAATLDYGAASVLVDGPASAQWTFEPGGERLEQVAAPPGDYIVTVSSAQAPLSMFWVAAYALDSPFDLQPGLREDSAFDPPR